MITYELYKHEKIWLRKCRKIFFEAIFSHPGKLFSKFLHIIFVHILRDIIGLEDLLFSFSQSQSGITMCEFALVLSLFAPVLHLSCTTLSQSESSNFFKYIIM